jgi:hypothetical protein
VMDSVTGPVLWLNQNVILTKRLSALLQAREQLSKNSSDRMDPDLPRLISLF